MLDTKKNESNRSTNLQMRKANKEMDITIFRGVNYFVVNIPVI